MAEPSQVHAGSAIPEYAGGCCNPCYLSEEILSSLEQEGLIEAKEISKWRVEPNSSMPAPLEKEVIMLKSHVDRGLNLPPSYFLKSMLFHYKLQLHHIAPNSFTIIVGFVALCEGYLGVYPRGDLFRLYFNIRQNKEANGDLRNCGSITFISRSRKTYSYINPHDFARGWWGTLYY
jgi:hypothetical protein